MPKILVVEDEQPIRELIKYNLEREGFQVIQAANGDIALDMAKSEVPDIILLDIMLPGQDGLSVCRYLHQDAATRSIPIIMLSARGEELDKVLGLEMGADDYITKPFSPRELIARIKARLRRQTVENQVLEDAGRITVGKLVIDQDRFVVSYNGIKQDLTPKEFELLRYLARNPGKVFTRDFLLEQIWGYDFSGDSRTVDVHIRHIRQKLEQLPDAPQFIETVRGVGYRFKEV
ncbi:two component transcriptional regulator, winged helix family [Desulforamulus reducens MI-1]|uniref:Stage 0 sporulation protein A homolog n=1 Tax=Desulforamulus reducens (strain ATCC BAA-1160 / DSM 100696 / MI-1) TaxID=349161 RepID=A4J2E3_DESRM|nr:response regulator transcription factor [Desulforamulus reducens]ABO49246.1 two component transcriptional regulator, winged helix family [Desulforamulus reducens MI-1]